MKSREEEMKTGEEKDHKGRICGMRMEGRRLGIPLKGPNVDKMVVENREEMFVRWGRRRRCSPAAQEGECQVTSG